MPPSKEFSQSGFVLNRIVEPRPTPEMAEAFPDYYEKLNREPGSINFGLAKES